MPPIRNPLPYVPKLESRDIQSIRMVVIHCTETPTLASARNVCEVIHYASGRGNRGHFYVDRDGRVEESVPIERVANHTRGWNPQSIGIELVNTGRFPDWLHSQHQQMTEPYPAAQIDALLALLADLGQRCPQLVEIAGHEDLDDPPLGVSYSAEIDQHPTRVPTGGRGTLKPHEDAPPAARSLSRLASSTSRSLAACW